MAALLPILALIVLMYFLLIRPQQRRMLEQQALLAAVAEGDEVVTTSGLYGFVTAIDGDVMWVEIAEGIEVRMAKGAIARRVTPAADVAAEPSHDALDAGEADAPGGDVADGDDGPSPSSTDSGN